MFSILYTGTDITADLAPYLHSLQFTDVLEGESDTLSLLLENRDQRWMSAWLPREGDTITASLGYEDLFVGPISFEIDEIAWRGAPDTFEIKALATPITKALRERNTVAYEDTTLQAIAQTIADKHGLELTGELPDIQFDRVTQKDVTDLYFLRELAADYGSVFKIESLTKLVFFREAELEKQKPAMTLTRPSFANYSLTRSSTETYRQAQISYQSPAHEFIEVTIGLDGGEVPEPKEEDGGEIGREDTLRISERVESLAVAKVRAVEALRRANRDRISLSASLAVGTPGVAAGVVVELAGFGALSGRYLVGQATHSLRPAYTTDFEARKVG